MSDFYALEQIAYNMATERVGLQGVNVETFEQNQRIVAALRTAAPEFGQGLLGIQIIGSRANGTSHVPSDLDLAVIKFGSEYVGSLEWGMRDVTFDLVQDTDPINAAWLIKVPRMVPDNTQQFVAWVKDKPLELAGLFEDGVYASGAMIALRAAALDVLSRQRGARALWRSIQVEHGQIYSSQLDRLRSKLSQRLPGQSYESVSEVINPGVVKQRERMIALPGSLSRQRMRTMRQLEEIPEAARKGIAFDIYEEIVGRTGSRTETAASA